MRQSIVIITVSLLWTSIVVAQKKEHLTSVQEKNLKGKVQTVMETEYDVSFNNNEPVKAGKKASYVYNFDSEGNLVENSVYNADGSLYGVDKYKYSKPGVQTEQVGYGSKNELKGKTVKEYDDNGFLITSTRYDSKGNITEKDIIKYEFIDSLHYKAVTEWGSNSKETHTVELNEINTIRSEVIEGSRYSAISNSWDLQRHLRRQVIEDTPGKAKSEWISFYDENGNIIKETKTYYIPSKSVSTITYTYTYDPQGNWTTRIAKNSSTGTTITERVIKYALSNEEMKKSRNEGRGIKKG